MQPGTPYCDHCGYQLTGAVDSSRCPECGKPLVEVLHRVGEAPLLGRRYQSSTRIFGLPLISIAFGPSADERIGRARGIIALGDRARGWVAIGGVSLGIFSIGGVAGGVFAVGGVAIGLFSLAGAAVGLLVAIGGGAFGGIATGGLAVGFVAQGGLAIGYYARGGGTIGPEAERFFRSWRHHFGTYPGNSLEMMLGIAALAICVAVLLLLIAIIALRFSNRSRAR